jgi:hypothetical protein
MLNRKKKVQESDTTKADSSKEARKQTNIIPPFVLFLFIFIAPTSFGQRILTVEEAIASALQKKLRHYFIKK